MRESFILLRRPDGAKHGRMWYVEFWDPSVPPSGKYIDRSSVGKLLAEIETHQDLDPCKKADARAIVELWKETHSPSSGAALLPYLTEFWQKGGKYSLRYAMDHRGKKELSDDYLYNSRKNVANHFKPFLEGQRRASMGIGQVTPKLLTDYKHYLDEKGIADSTINGAIKAVFVPINDFWMQSGAPERSPARLVSYVPVEEFGRDILSIAEAAKVFTREGLSERDRLILELAAFAGLRVSEACAARPERLTLESFQSGADTVEYYTYAIVEQTRGRKPKAESAGEATIPFELGKRLLEFYKTTWKEGWIFDGKTRGTSIQKKEAENISNAAICAALGLVNDGGCIKAKRPPVPGSLQERGLSFHAWRHWYVSHIRAATDKDLAQKLARHKSARMTDHYTHLTEGQRHDSAIAGAGILKSIGAEVGEASGKS